MEPVKPQNRQASLSKFSNTHLLQLVSKLPASVFFFSVILLCSSLFPFITFKLMQFLSCKISKNYMFLLCNGILVLIVKNSGLINKSQPQETNQINGETSIKRSIELPELKTEVAEGKTVAMEQNSEENVLLITEDVADDQIEEDEQGEEEVGLLSAEELNKKCEDFIRKMKAGIKFEAQQQILVH
ncbi:uncharacterized protein LOC110628617 [Manihot esculenta]|uniref:Uncharacterized protein n=1 Tax=Manihot esculenta TaxID=3983 RepID=A0ACB7GR35_MANES|nr:uncharacterized protein LOC110628617 [Manihot esculenta]KAG8642194.1 hypothetical protein MANES_12G064700v8 [Manihot esculenta]